MTYLLIIVKIINLILVISFYVINKNMFKQMFKCTRLHMYVYTCKYVCVHTHKPTCTGAN